ncbi:MAG TPA: hypothetical protein VMU13_01720 [Candidatus Paceibacterota bacterium]|nr:hypothetical protein [Candidatus Paceibacterota bacterium]
MAKQKMRLDPLAMALGVAAIFAIVSIDLFLAMSILNVKTPFSAEFLSTAIVLMAVVARKKHTTSALRARP